MTVLITGGGGFLGAWIVKRLVESGTAVRIFDRREDRRVVREIAGPVADDLDWVTGDVGELGDVMAAAEGTDFIIHLAALLTPACREDPPLGARVNLIGTLNVFEAARKQGMRGVAYASSAGVFGPDNGDIPLPTTLYGAFKLACEGCARAYWIDENIPSVGFRPYVIYGPGRELGLSAGPTIACREAASGRPYTIPFSGEIDMIFVDDVAAAFAAAATRSLEGAHALNLIGDVAPVEAIVREIGNNAPGAELGWSGEPMPINAHMAKSDVEGVLGPLPKTSLADGIARTVAHYRAQKKVST